jgi:hypothetical protein
MQLNLNVESFINIKKEIENYTFKFKASEHFDKQSEIFTNGFIKTQDNGHLFTNENLNISIDHLYKYSFIS